MRSDALRATAGLTAGILLIGLAWATAAASAATYTVWSCRGPDGKPASSQAWLAGGDAEATTDTCSDGGFLRARLLPSDTAPGSARGYRFLLPAGGEIAGYRIHLFAVTAKSQLPEGFGFRPEPDNGLQAGLDTNPGIGVTEIDEGCVTPGCVFGVPEPPLDPANLVAGAELKGDGLAVAARCGGGFGCYGQEGEKERAEVRLFRSEIDIRDDSPPQVGAADGSVPGAGRAISGAATIGAAVSDEGGGVASMALLIDGAPVDLWRAACSEPYTAPRPCPEQVAATFPVDTTALADGQHSAALRATDAAGNVTTGEDVPFTVAAPPPSPPAPPAPAPPAPIVIERAVPTPFAVPVEPRQVVVRAARERVDLVGGDARVSGTVRLADGSPAAGAKVIVSSHPLGVRRSPWRVERRLTADEAGRFTMAAGPVSRLLQLDVDDRDHRAVRPIEVELLNRLRVRVARSGSGLRNGSRMKLRVDVDGAGRGSSGKVALVQAVVGRRWATVDSLTLNSAGRAVWRYRFRGTTRRAVYRFRVRVERAGDVWPWPTTDSRVLRVPVRP